MTKGGTRSPTRKGASKSWIIGGEKAARASGSNTGCQIMANSTEAATSCRPADRSRIVRAFLVQPFVAYCSFMSNPSLSSLVAKRKEGLQDHLGGFVRRSDAAGDGGDAV